MGRSAFHLFVQVGVSVDRVGTTDEIVKGRGAAAYAYICWFAVWIWVWRLGVEVIDVSLGLWGSRACVVLGLACLSSHRGLKIASPIEEDSTPASVAGGEGCDRYPFGYTVLLLKEQGEGFL